MKKMCVVTGRKIVVKDKLNFKEVSEWELDQIFNKDIDLKRFWNEK